jgi:hypothetical protein
MKCALLFLVSLSAIPVSLEANVGETPAQVENHYGKTIGDIPTSTFGVMSGFVASGYVVGVKFIDGVSEMEMFSKSNQSDMAASEIDKLLKANSDGTWKAELTGKANWRRWRRDDGSSVALYDAIRHFLYINSIKYYEAKGQQIELQEWNAKEHAPAQSLASPASTASPAESPRTDH